MWTKKIYDALVCIKYIMNVYMLHVYTSVNKNILPSYASDPHKNTLALFYTVIGAEIWFVGIWFAEELI